MPTMARSRSKSRPRIGDRTMRRQPDLDPLGGEIPGRNRQQGSKSAVSSRTFDPRRATMLADLDLLLTAVFCSADDLLPEREKNARRSLTGAEVAPLCVAQAVMGISSDREFLAVARPRLGAL